MRAGSARCAWPHRALLLTSHPQVVSELKAALPGKPAYVLETGWVLLCERETGPEAGALLWQVPCAVLAALAVGGVLHRGGHRCVHCTISLLLLSCL